MSSINLDNLCSIKFDNVYMLFIAIPLVILLCTPFFIAIRKDNRNGHNVASGLLHILIAVLIAFSAAGTQYINIITETQVLVVADVSYSAERNLDTVDNYINEINNSLPGNSKLGVVCFGKDYELLTGVGGRLTSVKESKVDDSETNIAQALNYAATLFSGDVIKRIVVITDGRQTYNDEASDLRRVVSGLQVRNIRVDAIYLNDNINEDEKELQISGAEYTRNSYVNRAETVNVLVQSNYATRAFVSLYLGEERLRTSPEQLSVGINSVYFDLDTSVAGTFDYRVEVTADDDVCKLNNSYLFSQTVNEDIKVLLVSSDWNECTASVETYGENAKIDVYENDHSVSNRDKTQFKTAYADDDRVTFTHNLDIPYTVEDLCYYDEIILSSVDVTEIYDSDGRSEMFLASLDTVVSVFGKTLVTYGDMHIQQKTDGSLQRLDNMLPVRFGNPESEERLFTIVLDISLSMNMYSRMIMAKKCVEQLVSLLHDEDSVCFVFYAGDVEIKLPPTKLYERQAVLSVVNDLGMDQLEQGTLTGLGLNRALRLVSGLTDKYTEQQVMLITDGKTFESFPDKEVKDEDAVKAVETLYAYGIPTSVISVGSSYAVEDGYAWLDNLASKGHGRHFHVENEIAVGGVSFAGSVDEPEEGVIEKDRWITVNKPLDDTLKGVSLEGDFVSVYVLGKAKESWTTVLSVNHTVGSGTAPVPLYSTWKYSNGKVATYTGKFSAIKQYGGNLSSKNEQFFKNIFETCIPQERIDHPYTVSSVIDGKTLKLSVTPAQWPTLPSASIVITTPDGDKITDNFIYDNTELYYVYNIPVTGRYSVKITFPYGGKDYEANADFELSYEPEYDAFTVYEASGLYRMVGTNGTVREDGNITIEIDEKDISTYIIRFDVPFLIVCAILFVADIVIRKLKWNDIVSLFNKVGTRKGGKK